MHGNSKVIIALAEGAFAAARSFGNLSCLAFAYRTAGRLETLVDAYFVVFIDDSSHTDLYLLRVPDLDRFEARDNGVLIHLEPSFTDEGDVRERAPLVIPQCTPLSDFYYSVVQGRTTVWMRETSRWATSELTSWST